MKENHEKNLEKFIRGYLEYLLKKEGEVRIRNPYNLYDWLSLVSDSIYKNKNGDYMSHRDILVDNTDLSRDEASVILDEPESIKHIIMIIFKDYNITRDNDLFYISFPAQ